LIPLSHRGISQVRRLLVGAAAAGVGTGAGAGTGAVAVAALCVHAPLAALFATAAFYCSKR